MPLHTNSSPPNVLIGGPVRNSPGFPLKACGNDDANQGNDRIGATTARALFEARIEIAKSRRQEQYLDAKAGRHVHPDNAPVGINIENRSADKWQRLQPLIDQTELAVEK